MNKEKWEALLKEFWQSEYAPDEASLREGLIVKSFAEFCMVKEAAQPRVHWTGGDSVGFCELHKISFLQAECPRCHPANQ